MQKRKINALEFNPPISKQNLHLIKRCLKPISFQRFSIAKIIEEKTFQFKYQQSFKNFIQSEKVLECLTEIDFLKIYKEKQNDQEALKEFLYDTVSEMEKNIASNIYDEEFCYLFSVCVKKNSNLHRISDELTLSEFLELISATKVDSGPRISFDENQN